MGKDSMMHRVLHAIILVLIITSAIDVNSDEIKKSSVKIEKICIDGYVWIQATTDTGHVDIEQAYKESFSLDYRPPQPVKCDGK